jgi:hypothetical protein
MRVSGEPEIVSLLCLTLSVQLTLMAGQIELQDPLARALLSCCTFIPEAGPALCSTSGAVIMLSLLESYTKVGE